RIAGASDQLNLIVGGKRLKFHDTAHADGAALRSGQNDGVQALERARVRVGVAQDVRRGFLVEQVTHKHLQSVGAVVHAGAQVHLVRVTDVGDVRRGGVLLAGVDVVKAHHAVPVRIDGLGVGGCRRAGELRIPLHQVADRVGHAVDGEALGARGVADVGLGPVEGAVERQVLGGVEGAFDLDAPQVGLAIREGDGRGGGGAAHVVGDVLVDLTITPL